MPVKPVPPLPYWSPAVMVSVNAVPAVGLGFDRVKPANGPAATVKLVEVPLTPPDVTFKVVVWASNRVTCGVAVPLVKVTVAG